MTREEKIVSKLVNLYRDDNEKRIVSNDKIENKKPQSEKNLRFGVVELVRSVRTRPGGQASDGLSIGK